MKSNLIARSILKNEFARIQKKNSSYSLRALSKRLDTSVSTLSRILSGQRGLSIELAERIAVRLALDPQLRMELFCSLPQDKLEEEDVQKLRYLKLSADQYQALSEWHHFAILSLIETVGFESDTAFIAKRLGISAEAAEQAVDRLCRLNLIHKDSNDQWKRTTESIRTTDDVRSPALQRAHVQNISLATKAIEEVPVHLRDVTAITMPSNPELLPKAKELIRKLQDDLSDLMDTMPSTEVYKFCTQLIPLTQVTEQKENDETDQ